MKMLFFIIFFTFLSTIANAQFPVTARASDIECTQYCGHTYVYDSGRSTESKVTCTSYPSDCGEYCEISFNYTSSPYSNNYDQPT
ncbi:MAG: hypothetical protein IJ532_06935 [Alphaproteobacteria bacterium]|nr:hypothetical protein [Alphaproteobacteria bacterium]